MSDLDQMLYELALGANKPRYWAKKLRQEVRDLQRSAVAHESIGAGISVPWIEAKGGQFDILPHEGASLLGHTAESIPNATWTVPTFEESGATWSKGMKIDLTNGRIYFDGVPRDAVVLILCWADWAADNTGERAIAWKADDGSARYQNKLANVGDGAIGPELVHVRSLPSSQTYYTMEVYQSSGGALNLLYHNMTIMRLR